MPPRANGTRGGLRPKKDGQSENFYRIAGVDLPYDPDLEFDKPKPTPLFPASISHHLPTPSILLTSRRNTTPKSQDHSPRPKKTSPPNSSNIARKSTMAKPTAASTRSSESASQDRSDPSQRRMWTRSIRCRNIAINIRRRGISCLSWGGSVGVGLNLSHLLTIILHNCHT